MLFNENEIYLLAKLRMEETERKARNAWKLAHFERESWLKKVVQRWRSRQKPVPVPPNGGCACQCG
jgi:hypothetical protein